MRVALVPKEMEMEGGEGLGDGWSRTKAICSLLFYLLRILKSRETQSPPSLCTALKCDKPVTPHHEERAFSYSSVFAVKRGREGLVQKPTVPDVDGSRLPKA